MTSPKCDPKCDGCRKNLPWKLDKSLWCLETKSSIVSIPMQEKVADSFKRVVKATTAKTPIVLQANVPLVNLCRECWGRQADRHWGGAVDYETAAAKTTEKGVYFNNERPDYLKRNDNDNDPDIDRILTAYFHEMSHYWSYNHTGMDHTFPGPPGNWWWDERVTEYLALKTYFGVVKKGTYKTAYGRMGLFINIGVYNALRKIRNFEKKKVNNFPPPFNRLESPQPIEEALAKRFVEWYIWGPLKIYKQTLKEFVESEVAKFFFKDNDRQLGILETTTYSSVSKYSIENG